MCAMENYKYVAPTALQERPALLFQLHTITLKVGESRRAKTATMHHFEL